jgi:hypothetical protein
VRRVAAARHSQAAPLRHRAPPVPPYPARRTALWEPPVRLECHRRPRRPAPALVVATASTVGLAIRVFVSGALLEFGPAPRQLACLVFVLRS